MNTLNPSTARSNLYSLIQKTIRGHQPVRIASKEGNVVLLSEEEYESLLETAELLSVPGLEQSILDADKDIAEGKTYSMEEVFSKTNVKKGLGATT